MPAIDSSQDFLDSSLSLGMTWLIDYAAQSLARTRPNRPPQLIPQAKAIWLSYISYDTHPAIPG